MGWGELFQLLSYFLFASVLLAFFLRCKELKNKLIKRKKTNFAYLTIKDSVKQVLNGYENEMTISRYEIIVKATKSVIIHRQIRSRFEPCCDHQQGCRDEELLKSMMDSLLRKVQRRSVNEKHLVKALQFQLKS